MRAPSKWSVCLAALALCALFIALQTPEAAAGDGYLLLKGGVYSPQASDVDDIGEGFNGEVTIGKYFLPLIGAELGVGYFEASKDPVTLTVYPVTLAMRFRLPIPVVKPYAVAGGGAYFAEREVSGRGSQSDTVFGYFGGLGVDIKLLMVLLNFEAKYLFASPTFEGKMDIDGLQATVGVGLEF